MAQEIVHWCDVHMDRGERVVAATHRVTLDRQQPRELELCEDCWGALTGELAQALTAHGRRVKPNDGEDSSTPVGTTARAVKFDCPVPGCESRLLRESFRQHMRSAHDTTLAKVESKLGHTLDGQPLTDECPTCHLRFASIQAMSVHRERAHKRPRKGAAKKATSSKRLARQ